MHTQTFVQPCGGYVRHAVIAQIGCCVMYGSFLNDGCMGLCGSVWVYVGHCIPRGPRRARMCCLLRVTSYVCRDCLPLVALHITA